MPTYDYECNGCGHKFEEFQSITAAPVRMCPKCRKRKVRRLIGAGAGIIFKGSGFYQTDYRSESYKQAAQKDKPPAAASTPSSASSSSGEGSSGGASKDASSTKASAPASTGTKAKKKG
jgi:putative FmdB family regulatory protein